MDPYIAISVKWGSKPKNRPTHTMNSYLQNSSSETHTSVRRSSVRRKALRKLNALRAIPVYPIFEDEKSKGSTQLHSNFDVGSK